MHKARSFFTATELANGDVLVAGGYDGHATFPNFIFADAEIYRLHRQSWQVVTPMHDPRAAAVALRLHDGRVMVAGGLDATFSALASVELYDPRTGKWTMTGAMNDARAEDFTLVQLPGGEVLAAGGEGATGVLTSAELWNPRTGRWTRTASMHVPRTEYTTTVLTNGRILVVGGGVAVGEEEQPPPITATAEIYNPTTRQWTLTGSMHFGRLDHSAVRLRDGRVLVAGGGAVVNGVPRYVATAEIYHPRTGRWTMTGSMTRPHSEAEWASVLLPNGKVLVPAGFTDFDQPGKGSDVFNPATGTWSDAGQLSIIRAGHSAVVLRGNRGVLVIGGMSFPPEPSGATATTDLFR
jgi:N-acetylneuraminic acid mutarotase